MSDASTSSKQRRSRRQRRWNKNQRELEMALLAARVLGQLVREEYPSGLTLTEIAETWLAGGTYPGGIDALRVLEDAGVLS